MLTLEQIREHLLKNKSSLKAVAKEIGIHENALYRLMSGETKPLYNTVKLLSDYIEDSSNV